MLCDQNYIQRPHKVTLIIVGDLIGVFGNAGFLRISRGLNLLVSNADSDSSHLRLLFFERDIETSYSQSWQRRYRQRLLLKRDH